MAKRVKDIGEFGLIKRLVGTRRTKDSSIVVDTGDDGAVLSFGRDLCVLSTDTLVENVHFRRDWFSARQIGMKAVEVNVSDVASMGGECTHMLVSLIAPDNVLVSYLDKLYDGVTFSCRKHGISVVGGNVSRGRDLVITVTAVGRVSKKHVVTRSGARVGDYVFVSKHVGSAHAGLRLYEEGRDDLFSRIQTYFLEPKADVSLMKKVRSFASSMIDVSDGLVGDLGHVCDASGVGAVIYGDALPLLDEVCVIADMFDERSVDYGLYGGDDYGLLYTVPRDTISHACGFLVGEITRRKGIFLESHGKRRRVKRKSYSHF